MILQTEFGSWFALVVAILSVWRLTALICYEAGPFDVLSRFRKLLYHLHLGGLVECFYCMSFWMAAIVVILVYKPGYSSLLLVLAVSGGASIAERFLSK